MKFKILIAFCITTIGLRFLANGYPEVTEKIYSNGIYISVRNILDTIFRWINVPFWYIFWVAVAFSMLVWLIGFIRNKTAWKSKRIILLKSMLAVTCVIVIIFNWFWGYNYARIPLIEKMDISLNELDSISIRNELDTAILALISSKEALENHAFARFDGNIENKTRKYLSASLLEFGYHPAGNPRVFAIKPNGFLLRLGVLGVYWPFIGQGQVDNGIPDLIKPYTFAHEMSHAYGFTDEGECNFLAYMACKSSDDPVFCYSADIAYFRTVGSNYKYLDSTNYLVIRNTIPPAIRHDLDAINIALQKYPTWVSTTAVYDWYLKAEGIEEGIENYDNIIGLVHAWRKKNTIINK